MADGLEGRVALVTGAGRGLGRAYALALARLGCRVAVNSPPREGAATACAVVDEIRAFGGKATAFIGSVASEDGARAAVDATVDAYGGIDILIGNAGLVVNKPFLETSAADLAAMLDVHLVGPFAAAQRALPFMQERGWGRIVLTGSGSAAFGLENQAAYASAKAAIVGLCNVLKVEQAGAPIFANVVLPVAPPAGRTPASRQIAEMFADRPERLGPDWVAPLVCLLASDACPGAGGVYSAVAGRYARVFTALNHGWLADGAQPPTLAEIGDHVREIADIIDGGYGTPGSIMDEIRMVAISRSLPDQ